MDVHMFLIFKGWSTRTGGCSDHRITSGSNDCWNTVDIKRYEVIHWTKFNEHLAKDNFIGVRTRIVLIYYYTYITPSHGATLQKDRVQKLMFQKEQRNIHTYIQTHVYICIAYNVRTSHKLDRVWMAHEINLVCLREWISTSGSLVSNNLLSLEVSFITYV